MYATDLMGLALENPVIIAPGPWSRGEKLKDALRCNAGAIITESIVSESYSDTCPRYTCSRDNRGIQNIRLYSALELEEWIYWLEEARRNKRYGSSSKLIASIMGTSPSELSYLAKKIEKTGIDGIEIGFACPMGEGQDIIAGDPERVYAYTSEVVKAVHVPVSVKLSAAVGSLSAVVEAAGKAGASGISGIDTLRCILKINIETGKPDLPTYGGYSGAPIRPVGLATIASIAQCTDLPVIGMGGIENSENLIEYIMAGASAGAIGTAILLHGYDVVARTIRDLESWLQAHGVKSIDQIRGRALPELHSFEEIKRELKQARFIEATNDASFRNRAECRECRECIDCCLHNAISLPNSASRPGSQIQIDPDLCDGCGLCVSVCPEQKLILCRL